MTDATNTPDPPAVPFRRASGSDAALADLFADVLAVEQVGLDDDFFDLGGDSLGVIELVSAVRERFGLEIPASLIIDAPTVAMLSARLGQRRTRGSPLVIKLSDSGTDTGAPFFCVAGGGAPAVQLRAFANAMSPRPVYGVQARGLEERARPDRSVPRFAQRVLSEIRAIQPQGPYLLGGHSFGCVVAYEMACQLLAAGERVELLVLLDTLVPPWRTTREVQRLADLANVPGSAIAGAERAAGTKSRAKAAMSAARVRKRVSRAGARHYRIFRRRIGFATAGLMPLRGLHQYDIFYVLGLHIGRQYQPKLRFAGPALIVAAAEIEYFDDPDKELPDLGWSRLITGPITAVTTPGDHLTMIRRPHVAALANAINETIAARR